MISTQRSSAARLSKLGQTIRRFALLTLRSRWLLLYLAAVYLFVVTLIHPEIASSRNLADVLLSAMPLVALAVGQTIVIITGGIDLSLTSLVSLASVVGASLLTESALPGWSLPAQCTVAVGAVFLVGGTAGLVHGASVAVLRMPAFLVTLASLMFAGGMAELYTRSRSIGNLPEAFLQIGYGQVMGLPWAVIMVGLLAAAVHLALRYGIWGRHWVAIGQNASTARVSGIPIGRATVAAYVVSGLAASVATLLYMARLETGKPDLVSDSVLLDCIGAVVIGGTSLAGGRGSIPGTIMGAIFVTLIGNSLNFFGTLQLWHVLVIKGTIILVAAALEALRVRLRDLEGEST